MLEVVTIFHGQWGTTRGVFAGKYSQGGEVGNA